MAPLDQVVAARRRLPSGDAIKARMAMYEVSGADIARELGVTEAAVSRWITGTRRPRDRNLVALAQLFDNLEALVR